MPTVKIPPVLRSQTGGGTEVTAEGATVGDVLRAVVEAHPGMRSQLFADGGDLNRYVNVYLNDEDVRVLQGLETPVADSDTVVILPAMAGGLYGIPDSAAVDWSLTVKPSIAGSAPTGVEAEAGPNRVQPTATPQVIGPRATADPVRTGPCSHIVVAVSSTDDIATAEAVDPVVAAEADDYVSAVRTHQSVTAA
jgi:molybdopterin converting factor small subunit